ncbi:hypothetical protein KCU93_g197, partial [Aureobasidium melanogenum]
LRRCSIGDVRRRWRRKVLWWWRLVVLEVVTVLGMHRRCGRDRCRAMRRRLMLVVHRRQGRPALRLERPLEQPAAAVVIRVVVSHGSSIPRSYLSWGRERRWSKEWE